MWLVQIILIVLVITTNNLAMAKAKQDTPKKISFVKELNGIKEYRMHNGLKVLLKPDSSNPSFSWQVWYKVGSRNENLNYTGIAHYLEHIMFKGTEQFDKGEISQAIQLRGGIFNAFTGDDYTAYFENFSPENLELAIKIEADRMRNAKIDHDEVELERSVIVSELEGGRNNPMSILYENLKSLAYATHTYKNPVIGWRDDLDNINAKKIKEFYDTFYHPNNAVAILVGNFDEALALELIEKYFSQYQASETALPKVPQESKQKGLKEITIYNEGNSKILAMAFHIPEFIHEDSPAIELISDIVFSGLSSRLYPKLVDSGLATNVSGVSESSIDPGIFRIFVVLNPEADINQVEKIIDNELDAIKENLSEEEVLLAKAKEKSSFIYQRDGAYDEGMQIGYFEALSADWTLYTRWLDNINAVSVADVQNVAKKYFVKANKTVARLLPEKAPEQLSNDVQFDQFEKVEANYGAGVADPIDPAKFKKLLQLTEAQYSKGKTFPQLKLDFENLSSDNLKFYFREDSSLPLVYANFAFYAGNASEKKPGLAYIVSEMLERGSSKYDKFERSKLLDLYGADLDFTTNSEYAKIHMSTVSDNLDKVLDVLLDNLQKPNFDKDELEKLKELVIARLKVEDDSPQKIANRQITQLLYPSKHPYYIPSVDERIKAIETINIDDVKKFYQEHYNKENLYVSIVGDIKKAKAQEIVSSMFADLNKDFKSKNIRPEIEVVNNKKTGHEDVLKPDKTQSEIVIAHTGEVDRSHKDFYPLYVANFALGGSALSSRLGTVVRDDNGLVYNVRSSFNAGIGAGMYKIILGCNPKNVAKAIKITKETIDQFVQLGISELELKMTKSFMTGSLPVRNLSSMEDIAETLLQMLIYDLGENYIENYNENMSSISKKQVDAAAKTYIKTDDFSSVVVGPAYQ